MIYHTFTWLGMGLSDIGLIGPIFLVRIARPQWVFEYTISDWDLGLGLGCRHGLVLGNGWIGSNYTCTDRSWHAPHVIWTSLKSIMTYRAFVRLWKGSKGWSVIGLDDGPMGPIFSVLIVQTLWVLERAAIYWYSNSLNVIEYCCTRGSVWSIPKTTSSTAVYIP